MPPLGKIADEKWPSQVQKTLHGCPLTSASTARAERSSHQTRWRLGIPTGLSQGARLSHASDPHPVRFRDEPTKYSFSKMTGCWD